MEDLLQNIIKDAAGKQLQNLKQAAQIAYGKYGQGKENMDKKKTHIKFSMNNSCYFLVFLASFFFGSIF